jgi:hypothetical protein
VSQVDFPARTSQWILRPVVRDRELSRRLGLALVLEVLFFSGIVVCFLALGRMQAGVWFYVCGVGAIVLAIGFRINMDAWRYSITRPLARAPVDDLHGEPSLTRVTLDVVRGSLVTGTDRGSIWFESGAMCFLGQTTSFAITEDLIRPDGVRVLERPLRPFERRMMILLTSGWRLQIDLAPGQDSTYEELHRKISALEPGGEIRQHPPTRLGPGAFARRTLVRLVAAGAIQIAAFAVAPAAVISMLAVSIDARVAWGLMLFVFLRPWKDGWSGLKQALRAWPELALMNGG